MALLAALLVLITGKWRYQPDIYWSRDSYVRNLFRLYELVFWRRYGFRAEQSADSNGNYHLYSFEAKMVYLETLIRSARFERVKVPQLQYAHTPYVFQVPIFNFAWGLVSGQKNVNSGTAACTVTLANTPAQGDTLYASAGSPTVVASGVPTVTDGNLNALTQLASVTRSTIAEGLSSYAYIAGASQSTSAIATGFAADTCYCNFYEFSGGFAATNGTASSFIDNAQKGTASGSTSTNAGVTISLTTTNANDLVIESIVLATAPSTALTSSSLTIAQVNPGPSPASILTDAYTIETSTITSFTNAFGWNASRGYAAAMMALLPAATSITNHYLTLLGAGT